MRSQDAQDILRMIESYWHFDLGAEGRLSWRVLIEGYEDADAMTQAVIYLTKSEQYRPTHALLRMAYDKIMADRRSKERKPLEIDWTRPPMPEWIPRWFYARFVHTPPDFRSFHEQYPELEQPPKGEWMPPDAYVKESVVVTAEQVTKAVAGVGPLL